MDFLLIWTILAGTNVVHITGTECIRFQNGEKWVEMFQIYAFNSIENLVYVLQLQG